MEYVPIEVLKDYREWFGKQAGQPYPCSNQVVVCSVVTRDRDKALNFMKSKPIIKKIERRDSIVWELENGERWIWRYWNESCRGYRFYKTAVDRYIDKELFDLLILPCCGHYCCSFEII